MGLTEAHKGSIHLSLANNGKKNYIFVSSVIEIKQALSSSKTSPPGIKLAILLKYAN